MTGVGEAPSSWRIGFVSLARLILGPMPHPKSLRQDSFVWGGQGSHAGRRLTLAVQRGTNGGHRGKRETECEGGKGASRQMRLSWTRFGAAGPSSASASCQNTGNMVQTKSYRACVTRNRLCNYNYSDLAAAQLPIRAQQGWPTHAQGSNQLARVIPGRQVHQQSQSWLRTYRRQQMLSQAKRVPSRCVVSLAAGHCAALQACNYYSADRHSQLPSLLRPGGPAQQSNTVSRLTAAGAVVRRRLSKKQSHDCSPPSQVKTLLGGLSDPSQLLGSKVINRKPYVTLTMARFPRHPAPGNPVRQGARDSISDERRRPFSISFPWMKPRSLFSPRPAGTQTIPDINTAYTEQNTLKRAGY